MHDGRAAPYRRFAGKANQLVNVIVTSCGMRLMKDGNEIAIIADSTANNGEYTWRIKKKKFEPGKYQIRIDSVDDAVSFIVQSFSLTRN